jgi:hypothetical protein
MTNEYGDATGSISSVLTVKRTVLTASNLKVTTNYDTKTKSMGRSDVCFESKLIRIGIIIINSWELAGFISGQVTSLLIRQLRYYFNVPLLGGQGFLESILEASKCGPSVTTVVIPIFSSV